MHMSSKKPIREWIVASFIKAKRQKNPDVNHWWSILINCGLFMEYSFSKIRIN